MPGGRARPTILAAAVFSAARCLAAAMAIALVSGEAAWADCSPASANNVTATCTGTTLNQGGGAPGTSADPNGYGYGTGTETGVTVTVDSNATVTGTIRGINVGDGTVTVDTAGTVSAGTAIRANTGSIDVTNSGSITIGTGGSDAIYANTDATVTNNAGAAIAGGALSAIRAGTGSVTLNNSGSITNYGRIFADVYGSDNVTVTNNAGATLTSAGYVIWGAGGFVNLTNSGSISSNNTSAILGGTYVIATNNAGADITAVGNAIWSQRGFVNVINSGSISGSAVNAIISATYVTVTNNAGASIAAGQDGIVAGGGGSSVFNAGSISGGTAAIQFAGTGNTLTLAPGSVITGNVLGTGSDTLQLGGTGAATFDVSQLSPTGQYQGFGTFNKIDSSTWTLTGTSSYAGPVTVNGGTLNVDGDISSSSAVTVNAGGTLGGTGTVSATAINGGALAPGSSTALLTVQGNLSFTAASSYLIEVSPAAASRTNVTGTATLSGATLNANFAPGGYVARQYTILNATGGVTGQFGALMDNAPASITPSLSYDANDAYLDVAITFAVPGGLNRNQQNVANALTSFFYGTGGIPLAFAQLTPAGLTQASGEGATGSQQTTIDAMTQFMGVMTDPFTAGRGDVGASAPALAEPDDPSSAYASSGGKRSTAERDAYGMITKAAPIAPPFQARWNVWAAGFGGAETTDGNAALGSNTATSRIGGTAVGADYWLSPQTVAGFALAGGGTNFSVAGSGSGRSDLFQAGAFIRHTAGSAYVAAAAAYGWQDVTTDRAVTLAGVDQLRAEFDANAYSARVEAGNRYLVPWLGGIGLTPYAAAQVIAFDLPAYAEGVVSGANTFALAYAAKTVTATRSELGLRSDKSFAVDDAILTLRGRAAWAHDDDTDRDAVATFQTLPGASFVVDGAAPAHDAALTTASAEMKFISGVSLAATFEGEFSGVTRSYAGKGVARYSW
jgi:autotransporter-associated beta strand protein